MMCKFCLPLECRSGTQCFGSPKNTFILLRVLAEMIANSYLEVAIETYVVFLLVNDLR